MGLSHIFIKSDLSVDDAFIELCAKKYIECRGTIAADPLVVCNQPVFKNTGFGVDNLQKVIDKYTLPKRPGVGSKKPKHLDIYRSDLGELLMTMFFEEELAKKWPGKSAVIDSDGNFIMPLKNIWDREINDSPGRGIDGVGYRYKEPSKPTLFLGESKVSSEKNNPPRVVDKSSDSIYKTQKMHADDKEYLLRKLTNHCKKVDTEHVAVYGVIIMSIDFDIVDGFDIVYGCCMVRDSSCVKTDEDFGMLMTHKNEFEPNAVYFYIPSFDKPIEEVVELFYDAVQKLAGK